MIFKCKLSRIAEETGVHLDDLLMHLQTFRPIRDEETINNIVLNFIETRALILLLPINDKITNFSEKIHDERPGKYHPEEDNSIAPSS